MTETPYYLIDTDIYYDLPDAQRNQIIDWLAGIGTDLIDAGIWDSGDGTPAVNAIRWNANESIEVRGFEAYWVVNRAEIGNAEIPCIWVPPPTPPPADVLRWALFVPRRPSIDELLSSRA